MKKRDFQIILFFIFIALLFLLVNNILPKEKQTKSYAIIYIGPEEYKRVSIDEPQIVTINHKGHHNEIQITAEGIVMHASNCENQECIGQGEVTLDNLDIRPMGGWIICLPNEISIELIKGEDQ